MIDINLIWILSVVIFLLSFLGVILTAKIFTKPFDGIDFSFLRVFPSEVIQNTDKQSIIYKLCLYIFSFICFSPCFVIIGNNFSPLFLLVSILFGMSGISFLFLNVFGPSHVKVHLILFVLFACLTFLSCLTACFAILLLKDNPNADSNYAVVIAKAICVAIVSIFELILMLNPKLKKWAQLDKISGSESTYVRPKKFPLAYSEWATFLLLVVGEFIFFLGLIK